MASGALKGSTSYALGFFAFLISILLAYYFYSAYDYHPYTAWLWGASIMAFFMYGIDKVRTDGKKSRVPSNVLNGFALMGGFIGAWLGMFGFWHQVRRLSVWMILILSMILHGAIVYLVLA
jgi:uncharacterized membrane protein YsdA (DUF1294 family)